jgi:hypothetical protein
MDSETVQHLGVLREGAIPANRGRDEGRVWVAPAGAGRSRWRRGGARGRSASASIPPGRPASSVRPRIWTLVPQTAKLGQPPAQWGSDPPFDPTSEPTWTPLCPFAPTLPVLLQLSRCCDAADSPRVGRPARRAGDVPAAGHAPAHHARWRGRGMRRTVSEAAIHRRNTADNRAKPRDPATLARHARRAADPSAAAPATAEPAAARTGEEPGAPLAPGPKVGAPAQSGVKSGGENAARPQLAELRGGRSRAPDPVAAAATAAAAAVARRTGLWDMPRREWRARRRLAWGLLKPGAAQEGPRPEPRRPGPAPGVPPPVARPG